MKTRVLLIDDEEGFTTLLKENLETACDYEVYCENDPWQAVATAHDVQPDVVLLDLVMPGRDGGDVAGDFRRDGDLRYVPIIFVSALIRNEDSHGEIVVNSDGQQMLAKPFRFNTLRDCIENNVCHCEEMYAR